MSRHSAGGAVPYETVLTLAPTMGLGHSLLSADWDEAMGSYLFGRSQPAAGSFSAFKLGLCSTWICPFIRWDGVSIA